MHLGVAQLVARYLGVVEAASSSLVTQTRKRESKDSRFSLFYKTFRSFRSILRNDLFSALLRSFQRGVTQFATQLRVSCERIWPVVARSFAGPPPFCVTQP